MENSSKLSADSSSSKFDNLTEISSSDVVVVDEGGGDVGVHKNKSIVDPFLSGSLSKNLSIHESCFSCGYEGEISADRSSGKYENLTENRSRDVVVETEIRSPDVVVEDEEGDYVPGQDYAFTNVRCEPVVDFLHARVFTDTPQVYGYIRIIDLQNSKTFPAYDRHRFESPQRLYPSLPLGNFLQLSGPDYIPTLNEPMVAVGINTVETGDVIAHGQQHLSKSTEFTSTTDDAFEKLYTLTFQDEALAGDRVELQCVAFTFGVYACVQVVLCHDDYPESDDHLSDENDDESDENDDEQSRIELFGLIYAKCKPMLLSEHDYKNYMFNVPKEERVRVGFGRQIVLSKDLVVVPAYSDLEISLELKGFEDDDFVVKGSVCFEPSNFHAGWKQVRGRNGCYVDVQVTWQKPSLLNRPWCKEDTISSAFYMGDGPITLASHLLEVFSLFIARPNGKEVNMYGSVDIYCTDGWCNIFCREKDDAYFMSRGCNLLPLKGPERAPRPGMMFSISVDLRDVDGHVKIKGIIESSVGLDERQKPWFDRRLYSVVKMKGKKEKSFVAVHYTMFSYAVQAVVEVCLVWKRRSSAHVNIYGDIIASYDKEVLYSTPYDKKFFKRVLFTSKKANPLEVLFTGKEAHSLEREEKFVLTKNLVAVPMTSSLLAEVNLSFQTAESTCHVAKIVKFRFEDSMMIIPSDDVDICIAVAWKGFPYR
ncbi:hypothetical protein DCAR_0100839 [Daucus carota subsp. sativus]|uniref:DUF6598 domain-containing protein n=1 Tax=Daucus carota subsp. sativus TaxID=79200 RepID=A0A166FYJ5_DAUCS|nr:PREDICTED: uncharacterized protein LOC108214776 [Daucus carota subsp. sativus]WOG81688.1 hypothetical protein DCAR_0100839 [Daucus carota subsp. sativus]